MLTNIQFKFGSAPGQPPLNLPTVPSVTIFVGPNNSGKSQALREITSIFQGGLTQGNHIIESVTFTGFDAQGARAELASLQDPLRPGESLGLDHVFLKSPATNTRDQVHVPAFLHALEFGATMPSQQFAYYYARRFILSLDGPSRIALLNPQGRGDLKYPEQPFARLLTANERRAALRQTVFEATGLYFAIDASVGEHLAIRFGDTVPPNERSIEDETLEYMRHARGLDRVSDGVKAFTGILVQLHAGSPKVITVDEPEAFLHPSLAFALGKELARGAVEEKKHIFISTHSAQLLMGAISSGAIVNIVRLTYTGNTATARLLDSAQLRSLMHDPLLRSVGVLEGLFYGNVIVGEANADRAFYQEINDRLLAQSDKRGIPHALFLNADNKQTIPRILLPLRKLGIPSVGIFDIDVLKDGGQEWTRQLAAAGIPNSEFPAYQSRRGAVLLSLQSTNKDFKTEGGVSLLSGAELEAAENLLEDLARYGLFVVQGGEVENWLSDLEISRTKQGWLRDIFAKMGSDPATDGYIKPTEGDVWDFIGRIGAWVGDRNRKGIPT